MLPTTKTLIRYASVDACDAEVGGDLTVVLTMLTVVIMREVTVEGVNLMTMVMVMMLNAIEDDVSNDKEDGIGANTFNMTNIISATANNITSDTINIINIITCTFLNNITNTINKD